MKLRMKAALAVTASAGLVFSGMAPAMAAGTAGPTEHTDMGVTGDAVMEQLQNISDRMWTQATGTRTPINSLGKFWDDKAGADIDADSFLK